MNNKTKYDYQKVLRENFKWFTIGMFIIFIMAGLTFLPISKNIGDFIVDFMENGIELLEKKTVI